jgi:hypothetical protein
LADGVGKASNDKLAALRTKGGTDGRAGEETKGVPKATEELGAVVRVGQDLGSASSTHSRPVRAAEEGGFSSVGLTSPGEMLGRPRFSSRQR